MDPRIYPTGIPGIGGVRSGAESSSPMKRNYGSTGLLLRPTAQIPRAEEVPALLVGQLTGDLYCAKHVQAAGPTLQARNLRLPLTVEASPAT